ncbi:MAG: 23S rRNA (adenine2503-C2)-methyltransferase [Myxococcota bacterium]|jgi:23S rRNA (adenine2503-C2)-methyltransferase
MGLPLDALARFLDEIGVGATHAGRVFRGLHRDRLPLHEIQSLGRHAAIIAKNSHIASASVQAVHDSGDGTRRMVTAFSDGARVESVLIPMRADRVTLCLSTQVGCAMGCRFCATGTLGLTRHLTAGEIVAQIHLAQALLKGSDRTLRNLVFMGMGEPLHAYDQTRDAIRVLLDDHGLNFGARHVTVSTVGLVGRMHQLGEDFGGRVQLALSLHAGTDATRQAIIPIARAHPLAALRKACEAYPLPGRRALMLEYVVLPGINDSDAELDALTAWRAGLRAVVNLIPFNPFPGSPYRSPTTEEVKSALKRLQDRRVPVTVRWPRGRDADGACGQLALREESQPQSSAKMSQPGLWPTLR